MLAALVSVLLTAPMIESTVFESAEPVKIADGFKFTEGPCWIRLKPDFLMISIDRSPGIFLFCDMRANKVFAWSGKTEDKPIEVLSDSKGAVGIDGDFSAGAFYLVQTASRSIGRGKLVFDKTDPKKFTINVVSYAEKMGGKRLGGMNDVAVINDTPYVTHADWFIKPEDKEFDYSGVIRMNSNEDVLGVADGLQQPNGICFSPDRKFAYVTEYSAARINRYPVKEDGTFGAKELFADLKKMEADQKLEGGGGADGIRCDMDGRIFSTGPGGIWVLTEKGKFIERLPIRATNLAIGGDDRRTLIITTGSGVSTIRLKYKDPFAGN